MSEKQFEVDGVEVERYMLVFGDDGTRIVDNQTGKELYAIDIVGLLNEQQATITALNEENIELKKLRKYCAEWMGVKEENLYDVVR